MFEIHIILTIHVLDETSMVSLQECSFSVGMMDDDVSSETCLVNI